jgi:ADP-ribosylglycohydrolase
MKYLLLARFQGALIGGNIIYINSQQIAPNQLIIDTTPALIDGLNNLIDRGRFDDRDWSPTTFTGISIPAQAIVAMLPLMLFFHEDRVKLREILINVSHGWELDWETCSSAVAIGYIISRSISESFNPRTILAQLLDETINLHPLVFQELRTIDRLLERASSLHQVTQQLTIDSPSIVTSTILAIYCFLSTPEDFSVATRRADRLADRSQLICALTGMLAGVHNSLAGIPLNGYLATQERTQWLLAAENLLTAWAGVYHEHRLNRSISLLPASSTPTITHPLAVAAPSVIQPRN